MVQEANIRVELEGGLKIPQVINVRLDQPLFDHHRFTIDVPIQALEKPGEGFLNDAHRMALGKLITITIKRLLTESFGSADELVFKGIVTGVRLDRQASDFEGVIELSGYSPTILLEDGPRLRSFYKKTVRDVLNAVLEEYPDNVLKKRIKPRENPQWEYSVQYQEDNFHFLNRLAGLTGDWFFYDGCELRFGELPDQTSSQSFDRDLQSFQMGLRVEPINAESTLYQPIDDRLLAKESGSLKISGLHSLSQSAVDGSESLFRKPYHRNSLPTLADASQLADFLKAGKGQWASNLSRLKGQSTDPGLAIGAIVSLKGSTAEHRADYQDYGQYRVVRVEHSVQNRQYSNTFEAIPLASGTEYPPTHPALTEPLAYPEHGTVRDNRDPEGLGRVRVQLRWQPDGDLTPWIRAANPASGDQSGFYFVPEIGEQVMINYEQGNANFPFVIGSLYHGKAKQSDKKHASNYKKAIRTKSGNQIYFYDEPGREEIRISNPNSDNQLTLSLEGSGKITIETKGELLLKGDSIRMKANKMVIDAGDSFELKSEQIDQKAGQKMALSATSIQIEANAQAKLKGATLDIDGGSAATVKAGVIKLN